MVRIIESDKLIYDTEEYDVILVGTSIYCMLAAGFQSKMRFKYPFIEKENDRTPYGDMRKLGKRLTFSDIKPCISLMYISGYPHPKRRYIDYGALENCLKTADSEFSGMKVASTVIGTSEFDGNGDREKCLGIIESCTPHLDMTLYDYVQKSRRGEENEITKYMLSFKDTEPEKYKELLSRKKDIFKERYLL